MSTSNTKIRENTTKKNTQWMRPKHTAVQSSITITDLRKQTGCMRKKLGYKQRTCNHPTITKQDQQIKRRQTVTHRTSTASWIG